MFKASQILGAMLLFLLAFVHGSCTAQHRNVGVGADGLGVLVGLGVGIELGFGGGPGVGATITLTSADDAYL